MNDEVNVLNGEMSGLRGQLQHSANEISRQQEQVAILSKQPDAPLNGPLQWQVCDNIKISIDIDKPNILEFGDDNSKIAFAQSFCYLESKKSFKIQILNVGNLIGIGLTRKGHPIDERPGYHRGIGYNSNGQLDVKRKCEKVGSNWRVGDIIECGIEKIDGSNVVQDVLVYFFRNGQLITKETVVETPNDVVFPTVFMEGTGAKIFDFGIENLGSNLLALGLLKRRYIHSYLK